MRVYSAYKFSYKKRARLYPAKKENYEIVRTNLILFVKKLSVRVYMFSQTCLRIRDFSQRICYARLHLFYNNIPPPPPPPTQVRNHPFFTSRTRSFS